jgi:LuxR family quorum sensing-dependent transcriptional regulator
MRRAADFRMVRGFIVPIHGFSGYEAAVSLGGVDLDLNLRSKPALHLMRRLLDPKTRCTIAAYATGARSCC